MLATSQFVIRRVGALRHRLPIEDDVQGEHLFAPVHAVGDDFARRLAAFVVKDQGCRRVRGRRDGFQPHACGAQTHWRNRADRKAFPGPWSLVFHIRQALATVTGL